MKLKKLLVFIIFLSPLCVKAQTDESIFESCIEYLDNKKSYSITDIALYFIDKPYKAGTLEINSTEQLVVNLREFDCTTLVESVLAIYLTMQQESDITFESFKNNLTKIRYRNGEINGYLSRLHYSSDWITDNRKKNILKDITKDIGGDSIHFKLNFMSSHSDKYPYLKKNPDAVKYIKAIENELNKLEFYYIPKTKINLFLNKIQDGDVILYTTSIEGLDISHMGIVHKREELITFIHASQKYKKVIINPESIYDYCKGIRTNKGIVICRVN